MPSLFDKTVVRNTSGTSMYFDFLGLRGATLAAGEDVAIPGAIWASVLRNSAKLAALDAALTSGRLVVLRGPSVIGYDAEMFKVSSLGFDNGAPVAVDPEYGAYSDAPPADVLTGLLAYYRLGEDGADSSGNGLDLSPAGAGFGPGVLGQQMTTGSAGRVGGLGSSPAAWTVSSWFEVPEGVLNFASNFGGCVLVGALHPLGLRGAFFDGYQPGDENGVWAYILPAGFHHLVAACDGAEMRCYVDGSFTGLARPVIAADFADDVTVHTNEMAAMETPVSHVAVYSRALSAADVAALYNGGAGFDPTA